MKMQILFYPVVFLCLVANVQSEYYTSTESLVELLDVEAELLENLKFYIDTYEEKLDILQGFHDHQQKEHQRAMKDPTKYVENPINAFHLISRLWNDWDEMDTQLQNDFYYRSIKNLPVLYTLPSKKEFSGAAQALFRLQDTYKLSISELECNKYGNNSLYLNARDCQEIGIVALENKDYYHSRLWLTEARKRYEIEIDSTADVDWIDIYINQIDLEDHGNNRYLKDQGTIAQYQRLCRGENLKLPNETSKYKCMYVRNDNPFLLIAPFKMEQLNLEPPLLLFHDVISDEEIQEMKAYAYLHMNRSEIVHKDLYGEIRVSQTAWMNRKHSLAATLEQRMSDFTGLSSKTAEDFQIVNYGIGGHYGLHEDFLDLNDVTQGGMTALPFLRTAVPVKKGTAVMWYNLQADGTGDWRSTHGGCPVFYGNKWGATKWIRSYTNEFIRKCDLKPNRNTRIDTNYAEDYYELEEIEEGEESEEDVLDEDIPD